MINAFESAYFHGFKVERYLESDAFRRLQKWLGIGLCYELSALAMVLMKHNHTASLCRGDYYDENGELFSTHSWVEFKIPLNGWHVLDFAWVYGINTKKEYFRYYNSSGKFVTKRVFTYEEFWRIPYSSIISETIKKRTTSNILLDLSAYTGDDGYAFTDWIYEETKLGFTDGIVMMPHLRKEGPNPISTAIIRDFVKRPNRRQPKAKSIRMARSVIKKYELLAELATEWPPP